MWYSNDMFNYMLKACYVYNFSPVRLRPSKAQTLTTSHVIVYTDTQDDT